MNKLLPQETSVSAGPGAKACTVSLSHSKHPNAAFLGNQRVYATTGQEITKPVQCTNSRLAMGVAAHLAGSRHRFEYKTDSSWRFLILGLQRFWP
nr:hypothetical protein [uncultured Acidovorax sp.]